VSRVVLLHRSDPTNKDMGSVEHGQRTSLTRDGKNSPGGLLLEREKADPPIISTEVFVVCL
jgi:hypothetical protein